MFQHQQLRVFQVDGYDTNIGERGTALSGGQRQRLAPARMFLSDALILSNLHRIRHHRTVFAIAHRFAALKAADLILVLENGVLVEHGKHEELIDLQGVYWTLYQRQ
jgi:ATP-binding cassette, subfamily B, bacterial